MIKTQEALAMVGGHVNEELLLRNEYLATENEILRSNLQSTISFSNCERIRLAKLGKRIGIKALRDVAMIVKPETILTWYRTLVASKFDGSKKRKRCVGRPATDRKIEFLILKMSKENPSWGYSRIVGALSNLGHKVTNRTVANILKRNGITPNPSRKLGMSWSDFISSHQDVITACDFFTTEVLTATGLITFYVLFFIQIGSRKVHIAGVTKHPNEAWMKQIARNLTMVDWGFLEGQRYLIFNRDTKFCASFRKLIRDSGVKLLRLPPLSPNLNAYAERFVRTIKEECLSRLILFDKRSLCGALRTFLKHYHYERNHQGKHNLLLLPTVTISPPIGKVKCKESLGGLLKFYHRNVA